jgi:hypothetical protein
MFKQLAHPIPVRSLLWLVAAVVTAMVFLEWSGGFAALLESINDLF